MPQPKPSARRFGLFASACAFHPKSDGIDRGDLCRNLESRGLSLPEAVSSANHKATVVYPNIAAVDVGVGDMVITPFQVNGPRPSDNDMNASLVSEEKF